MNHFLKKNIRNFAFIICGIGFAFGVVISVNHDPDLTRNINFFPALFVLLVGVPLTISLNAFEYVLMGKLLGKKFSFPNAIEICILASAANMLPLPGGMITRVASMKKAGVTFVKATTTNLLFGFVWLALAFLVSGAGLLFFTQKYYGWIFLLTGTTLLTLSTLKMIIQGASLYVVFFSIIQRAVLITVDALRLWGCLHALGIEAKLSQTTIFALGGVLGSAVSVVPAGLGVREGLSAGLAPLVGLGAAAGFLAAALNRLLGLSFLSPSAFLLLINQRRNNSQCKVPKITNDQI